MFEYELDLDVYAQKHLVIKADSEEDALSILEDILMTEVIPITPEDEPDVNVSYIERCDTTKEFE